MDVMSITDLMDVSLSEFQELVMDREVWRAAIRGAAESWTWLSDWTELNWKELTQSYASKEGQKSGLIKAAPDLVYLPSER